VSLLDRCCPTPSSLEYSPAKLRSLNSSGNKGEFGVFLAVLPRAAETSKRRERLKEEVAEVRKGVNVGRGGNS
jgi:hypothetical protein